MAAVLKFVNDKGIVLISYPKVTTTIIQDWLLFL